jgi:hypothetical protein
VHLSGERQASEDSKKQVMGVVTNSTCGGAYKLYVRVRAQHRPKFKKKKRKKAQIQ